MQTRILAATLSRGAVLLLGLSLALAGASPTLALASTAMGVAGAAMLLPVTAFSVAVQQACPTDMLGRVMALWLVAFLGVRPIAGVAEGFVTDLVSAPAALFMTLIVVCGYAGIMFRMHLMPTRCSSKSGRRQRDLS